MEQGRLDIRLLGKLEVRRAGEPLSLPRSKKTRALLGYFVTTGRMHTRQQLCDLLWEGPADPRAALRWSLSKLRPLVDDDQATRLVTERDRVGFEPHGAVVDLTAVREQAAPDPAEPSTEALQEAAAKFRGAFLEGLDLSACYRFDAWCTAERESVHTLHDTILRVLIERLRNRPAEALRYARDRLLLDPLAEEAHGDLMRILGRMGRTEEALEQYERCRRMLEYEFDARPSPALEAVRRSLVRTKTRPVPAAPPEPARAPARPLVGRAAERAMFKHFVGDEEAAGDVLLLAGPPGIGKTRLLEELGAQARAAGGQALAGRACDVERMRPYGPWIDALRAVPSDRIPKALHAGLASLLPELGAASAEGTDRNRLFDAVLRLLVERAAEEAPLVVLLDDLHWFDDASVALLHYVARSGVARGVRLACTARSADLDDHAAARRLVHALHRDDRLRRLDVAPMDAQAITLLIHDVDADLDADRIVAESEGNPLFALEIARALQEGEDVLSDTLEGLITERLAALDPQARNVIPWAAALGRRFDLDVLARMTRLSSMELLQAVEDIERRGLFCVTPSGDYDFTHDLVRRAAYEEISPPRRRLIHLQIARTWAGANDLDDTAAGEIAHHAALGGDAELAARACVTAGRHSQRVFAYEETAALIERGREHLDGLPKKTRLPLYLDLLTLYAHAGMAPFSPPDFEDQLRHVTRAARTTGRPALVRRGFYLIGWLHYLRGDLPRALQATLEAEDAGRAADREADPATVVRAIADSAHCLCLIEQDMDRAETLAQEARALAEEFDLQMEGYELPMALAILHQRKAAFDEARRFAERGLQCSRQDAHPWAQYSCLSRLAMIALEQGCPDEARAWCRDLVAMTETIEEGSEAPFAAALDALARRALGAEDATSALDDAVERLRLGDSKWMRAYVQNVAATHDFEAGRFDAAHRRADDALAAAEAVSRRSEVALARALLAQLALQDENPAEAARHLEAVQDDRAQPHALSARARQAVEDAAQRLEEVSQAVIN